MRPSENLSAVRDQGLCVACGACTAVDPTIRIRLNPLTGAFEPSAASNIDAAAVCPSVQVDFRALHDFRFPGAAVGYLGAVDSLVLAQSRDRDRNLSASSGGVIREIIDAYLKRGDVDGAIALAHVDGITFEPRLISNRFEVNGLPGSIYHAVSFTKGLELLASKPGRYIVVALPCQLEGIYNFVFRMAPELAARIACTIGLVCGWTYTHHSLATICHLKGLDFGRVEDVAYRGGGRRGALRILQGGRWTAVSRERDLDYLVAFDRSFNLPRCMVCVNHLNYLAEFVVGDAWIRRASSSSTGISVVITRTKRATNLLSSLRVMGKIKIADATPADVVESQSRQLVMGDFAYAYAEYRRSIGLHCPDMTSPNRPGASLVSALDVGRFHNEYLLKRRLQQAGRYKYLWWRKLLKELAPDGPRYLRKLLSRQSPMGASVPSVVGEGGFR